LLDLLQQKPQSVELFRQTKPYAPSRSEEIFKMLSNGLLLSAQNRFDLLYNLYNND